MKNKAFLYVYFILTVLFIGCQSGSESTSETTSTVETKVSVQAPVFNGDSAYYFVAEQVKFGPRVPNSSAHKRAGDWFIQQFESFGWVTTEQRFSALTYDGVVLKGRNIIASFNPDATKRILLAAHWDSRPIADKDVSRMKEAIDGANDGASGVGVLLEIARVIHSSNQKPNIGIDIILFDAEDWGAPNDYTGAPVNEYGGYCLGSDYWSKNLHKANYSAYFGILLDMVGDKNATFRYDSESMQVAPSIVNQVWGTAQKLGFGNYFILEEGGGIVDDHVPVIRNAKIPMIDIIDLRKNEKTFFDQHHTHGDSIQVIDKNTLKAVGQTVLQVLYEEMP